MDTRQRPESGEGYNPVGYGFQRKFEHEVEEVWPNGEPTDDDFDLPNSQESSSALDELDPRVQEEPKKKLTLAEEIQAKIRPVLMAANAHDVFYELGAFPYLLSIVDQPNASNPFKKVDFPPGGSVAEITYLRADHGHLLIAQKTLVACLGPSRDNESAVCKSLRQWSDAIAPRIAEGNLDKLQRAVLVELIYRNLTIALLHESRESRQAEINRIIGSSDTPTPLMKGTQLLNEKTSSWRGWKIAAGLGLIFLVGIPLVVVAGASIASGYGLPLAPFFTTMVSWNSGAVLGAIAYMMGLAYCKKQQWKREDSQEQLTSGGKVIPLTPTTQRIKEYLSNHKTITSAIVATPLIGGAAAVGTSFIKGVVPSIQSASLSMGDIWSAKAKASVALGDKVLTGGNVGVAGITALMLAVAGAGTDAIRRGLMLIFSDAWNDRKVRRLGLGFLREVTDPAPDPDPVQVGASGKFSPRKGK